MTQRARHGAALSLINVTKRYGETVAVDDISLDIAPGDFVTLLGPSGSGKTTTLNMIAGFTTVTSGEILVDGKPMSGVAPHRRNLGMVFQNYALFPHMTAFDNVAFPLRRRKLPKSEVRRRTAEALELVKLGDLAHRYPAQLSGGQQQRVALARAVVFSPRILLMDEPLGALDRKLRDSLQLEIRHLHKELGLTFVFVTHDQEEALTLSDRIAIFNNGRIEQVGTSEELYQRPANEFVARFLGESNLLAGRVAGGRRLLDDDSGRRRFVIPPTSGFQDGDRAAVLIRPDRLRVAPADGQPGAGGRPGGGQPGAGGPDGEVNEIGGTVMHSIFLGATRRVVVGGDDGRSYVIREAGGDRAPVVEGQRVMVSWRAADSLVLAPSK